MPVANIIDKRKRQYRSFPITAVIEPAYFNNDSPSADEYNDEDDRITTCYEERPDTSLYLAINLANTFKFPVTLYLYDFELDEEQVAERTRWMDKFNTLLSDADNTLEDATV